MRVRSWGLHINTCMMEKSRPVRNLIYILKDSVGAIREGTMGVLDVAHSFYSYLFTSEGTDPDLLDKLPDSLLLTLTHAFCDMCNGCVMRKEFGWFPAKFWGEVFADLFQVVYRWFSGGYTERAALPRPWPARTPRQEGG